MITALDLTPGQNALVSTILQQHLPPDIRVFAFGSRAHGGAQRYSDLDLALDQGHPIAPRLLVELAEAFSESDLPFTVDLVDLASVDPGFDAGCWQGR